MLWRARDSQDGFARPDGAKARRHGDNAGMALKLFRTTGYSTILFPGETRLAMHPAWLVLAASLWLAIACNVGLWRLLGGQPVSPREVLAVAGLLGGGSAVVLSLLGWRRTVKLAITALLLAGALVACGMWTQDLPLQALWTERPRALLPGWATFMGWQVPVLVLVLALIPIVWVWNHPVRRLPGPAQLQVNILGAVLGACAFGGALFSLP